MANDYVEKCSDMELGVYPYLLNPEEKRRIAVSISDHVIDVKREVTLSGKICYTFLPAR